MPTDQPQAPQEASYPIGEVADRLRLSLRTLRYWEEVGLVLPTGRDRAGSRLYSGRDIERLAFIRAMKPIDFTIDELRDLLAAYDRLVAGDRDPATGGRGAAFAERIRSRCEVLERRIVEARDAADLLEALVSGRDPD